MTRTADIQGREFDWFALDASGAVALFATAGSGAVPRGVLEASDAHDAANDLIPLSGWGSPNVWASYAAVGLFAYDWHEPTGKYRRVATPEGPVPESLGAALEGAELPAFRVRFSSCLELGIQDLPHDA